MLFDSCYPHCMYLFISLEIVLIVRKFDLHKLHALWWYIPIHIYHNQYLISSNVSKIYQPKIKWTNFSLWWLKYYSQYTCWFTSIIHIAYDHRCVSIGHLVSLLSMTHYCRSYHYTLSSINTIIIWSDTTIY